MPKIKKITDRSKKVFRPYDKKDSYTVKEKKRGYVSKGRGNVSLADTEGMGRTPETSNRRFRRVQSNDGTRSRTVIRGNQEDGFRKQVVRVKDGKVSTRTKLKRNSNRYGSPFVSPNKKR
jgi:hypothetical protein